MLNQRIVKTASALTAMTAGAILLTGCGLSPAASPGGSASKDANTKGSPQVATVEVVAKDLAQKIELPGSVEGYESVELYAKIGGYLKSIAADIGDEVREGQVLAKLHVPEMLKELDQKQSLIEQAKAKAEQARAAVHQAEADIAAVDAARLQAEAGRKEKQALRDLRQSEFDRWTDILEKSPSIERRKIDEARHALEAADAAVESHEASIRTAAANVTAARAKFDKARADEKAVVADVAVAQANYEQVATMLDYAEIKAPFDGVVTRRLADPGSFIQPAPNNSGARPLVSIARIDRVRIALDIPMPEVRLLDLGDRAVFDRITVLPGQQFDGKVARFSRSLDRTSRMMRTEIDLENPAGPDGKRRLLPGYFGYVTIYLAEYKDAPTIPASALITRGNKSFVYLVQDGRVHPREVTSGYQDGAVVGIASGLEPGEVIVGSGAGQLREGQEVIARTPPRTSGG
jgi:RND family efflux transporter MFP subunit